VPDCGELANTLADNACAANRASCGIPSFVSLCAFTCAGCAVTTSTAPVDPCVDASNALSDTVCAAGSGNCETTAAWRNLCARSCANCNKGSTAVTGAATMYKGEFKHGYVDIIITYRAPSGITGLVDLFPVIRYPNRTSTNGVLDNDRTRRENPGLFNLSASGGTVSASIGLFSQVADGDFIIEVEIIPAGSNYGGRFRKAEMDVGTHAFELVNEYLRLDSEDPSTTFTVTGSPAQFTVGFRYFSRTSVKIAAQVRCDQPPALRESNPERYGRCDWSPHLVNSGASIPTNSNDFFILPANLETGPSPASVTVSLFSSIYRLDWTDNDYFVDISMGRYDSTANNAWLETVDRTANYTLIVVP
jgi:hypothetical protein